MKKPYAVLLQDTMTGEVRKSETFWYEPIEDEPPAFYDPVTDPRWHPHAEWAERCLFWWTEGNMGCDCNRISLFYPDMDGFTAATWCNVDENRFVLLAIIEPDWECMMPEKAAQMRTRPLTFR